jgi:hypothetical protein
MTHLRVYWIDPTATVMTEATWQAIATAVAWGSVWWATEVKQDTQITALNNILLELKDDVAFNETIWFDKITPTLFYVRIRTVNQDTGVPSITWTDIWWVTATPTFANLVQVSNSTDYEFNDVKYKAIVWWTGYSINDIIQKLQIINMSTGVIVSTLWNNETTGLLLWTAPTFANLIIDDTYANKTNQSTQITLATTLNTNIGNTSDTSATDDVGNFNLIALTKRGLEKQSETNDNLVNIKNSTDAINNKDIATETTLDAINTKLDQYQALWFNTKSKIIDSNWNQVSTFWTPNASFWTTPTTGTTYTGTVTVPLTNRIFVSLANVWTGIATIVYAWLTYKIWPVDSSWVGGWALAFEAWYDRTSNKYVPMATLTLNATWTTVNALFDNIQ